MNAAPLVMALIGCYLVAAAAVIGGPLPGLITTIRHQIERAR